MPSLRSRLETACRIGAFALIGWLIGSTVIPPRGLAVERANDGDLPKQLERWTHASRNVAVHATLNATPDVWVTSWLSALQHSGRSVSWSGSPAPIAMSVEPLKDPNGGARIDVAAPNGSAVAVRDDASPIDSVRIADLGGTITSPLAVGTVRGDVKGQRVASLAPDSVIIRPVLVVGAAGWEGKYVVSALEERGWAVVARFTVAPNVDVTDGAFQNLDTSRVSAVIAIDSTVASLAPALDRFVRSGGGLVLAGPAAGTRGIADLAPGSLAPRTRPNIRATDTIRLGSTGFYPVSSLRQDGVALERRPEGVAVAARRIGSGRVIQVGYDDSWRWRMAGAPGSEAAHREWWSRVVASVAYAPAASRNAVTVAESAPLADLVDRLGPPRSLASDLPSKPVDRRIILTLITVLLSIEWASRRLRGLK